MMTINKLKKLICVDTAAAVAVAKAMGAATATRGNRDSGKQPLNPLTRRTAVT